MWTSLSTISLSRSSRMLMSTGVLTRSSEVEAALARGVGERLHSPVIDVSATVNDHVGDSGLLGPFRNQLPDLARGGLVGAPSERPARVRLTRRSGGWRHALLVIDHLGVDVAVRAKHRKPRAAASALAQSAAHPHLAPLGE